MLSLATIGILLVTPAMTMLAASFIVSVFESEEYELVQHCIGQIGV